ncbi:MAG: 16S rRNA (adenine1518-N6/adenine1519-N6)-dimethyltransferase [Parcubacteria group bacterium Gr01-1014_38]|nr:MAG: 16S rRNA (adenine1518-N6/adenine1519-N6)-dimethyltransferase [Parcubacteria group bacterium Gr01-1014_38]
MRVEHGMHPEDPLLDERQLARYLRQHHLSPLHRFGQHFLVDAEVLHALVQASETDPTIPTIEIGAGLGVLTRALAERRQQAADNRQQELAPLLAVELDRRLIPLLRERVRPYSSVRIIQGDILKMSLSLEKIFSTAASRLPSASYDVIGSIPYNITAPILEKFLAQDPRPRRLTVLVDQAVANVIAAAPPHVSVRTVSVQVFAEPSIVRDRIAPSAFIPKPAVPSAILALSCRTRPLVPPEDERAFFRLVRAGFSQKRKTLANALAAAYHLSPADAAARLRRAGIDPSRRAQTLAISEWKRLLHSWGRRMPPERVQAT